MNIQFDFVPLHDIDVCSLNKGLAWIHFTTFYK